MGKFLKPDQRKELLEELKIERARKYADRIRVILLLDDGETYKDISKFLFLDEGTIANYRKRYKEGGIEELINDYYTGKRAALSEQEQKILTSDLKLKIFPTTMSVIAHIKLKFKIEYSRGGVTELLHRLGFSFKKATPVPGKAKKEKQQQFINQYNGIKPHGMVYFADSTHPEFGPRRLVMGGLKRVKTLM
jgi:transposase